MKTLLGILAVLALVAGAVALSVGLDLFGLFYQSKTAPIRGSSNAERQIESAPSRIQNYEEFFALCSGIQAKEGQIRALQASNTDRAADMILGLESARQQLIAEYNAMSAQDYTAARFKDAGLPYRIDAALFDGSNPTACK